MSDDTEPDRDMLPRLLREDWPVEHGVLDLGLQREQPGGRARNDLQMFAETWLRVVNARRDPIEIVSFDSSTAPVALSREQIEWQYRTRLRLSDDVPVFVSEPNSDGVVWVYRTDMFVQLEGGTLDIGLLRPIPRWRLLRRLRARWARR